MITYVISMSRYNVAADNVVRQLPYLLGRVGSSRRGTLAGDYHNDTRWDHQEL